MTRHDPAQGGAGKQVGTCSDGTRDPRQNERARGAYLRVDGNAETFAAELVERFGPAFAELVAHELVAITTWSAVIR